MLNQDEYKLLLLDTNILREIITNKQSEKNLLKIFVADKENYAFCFSIYNIIELKPYKDLFAKFIELFSILPCFMIYPFKNIIQHEWFAYQNHAKMEIDHNIANAFSPLGKAESFHLKLFIDKLLEEPMTQIIENELHGLADVATSWEKQRKQLIRSLSTTGYSKNIIDDKFFLFQEKQSIMALLKNLNIKADNLLDYQKFPAARIMLYSQFRRVHFTQKLIKKNDVMDIKISSILPYVDAVVTESFQADVCKKAKRIISDMKDLEIYTLADIRLLKQY